MLQETGAACRRASAADGQSGFQGVPGGGHRLLYAVCAVEAGLRSLLDSGAMQQHERLLHHWAGARDVQTRHSPMHGDPSVILPRLPRQGNKRQVWAHARQRSALQLVDAHHTACDEGCGNGESPSARAGLLVRAAGLGSGPRLDHACVKTLQLSGRLITHR